MNREMFYRLIGDTRVPLILTALLACATFITISQAIIAIVSHPIKIITAKMPSPNKPLDTIADAHLFGVFSANMTNLPATALPFILTGTVVSVDSLMPSYALIALPSQKTKIFKVGDTLPDHVILTHIADNFVILDNHGLQEKLAQNKRL